MSILVLLIISEVVVAHTLRLDVTNRRSGLVSEIELLIQYGHIRLHSR